MRKSPTGKYHSIEGWLKEYCQNNDISFPKLDALSQALYAHVNKYYTKIQLPVKKDLSKNITINAVLDAVAKIQGVEVDQLTQHTRNREIVDGRKLASLYLSRRGFTLKTIGKALGGLDHATAHHAIKSLTTLMSVDSNLRSKYRRLENELRDEHHVYPPLTRVRIKSTGEYGTAFESNMGFISVFVGRETELRHFMMDEVDFITSVRYGKDML